MRTNGREPLWTSQMVPTRVSLYAGERPQVACPICGAWRWLKRGMLRPHRADDGTSRCPGSGQPVTVDETPRQWRTRLERAAQESPAGVYAVIRTGLDPVAAPNGRPRLRTSAVDARRVQLSRPESCRLACPLCGRWRSLRVLPDRSEEPIVGAHRADDGVTRCPGSGQRVAVDETPSQWRVRLEQARREAARVEPAVAALREHRLDLEIELPDSPPAPRRELTGV